jgi:hypothetical protein
MAYMPTDTPWPDPIGDPTLLGWSTTAAYLVAAALCWRAAAHARVRSARLGRWWAGFALATLLLGINKELDLQALLFVLGKSFVHAQGWYGQRRAVQALFVGVMLLSAGGLLAWMLYRARALLRQLIWPFAGLALIGAYAGLHVVSVHLWRVSSGSSLAFVIELTGIALVAWGAWRAGTSGGLRT